ncbi:MAG: hypothetical protein M3O68_01485, partial [Thermoproteota archaeon]|nr:hypothetical protein [Thermoproteota archaeon]
RCIIHSNSRKSKTNVFTPRSKFVWRLCRVSFFPLLFFRICHIFGAAMILKAHQFNIVFRI